MKPRDLETLLSVTDACKVLRSYSRRDVLRMLDCGELRGLYQMRGTRRHWSIPVSALVEFIERLMSNQDDFGCGLDPLYRHLDKQPLRGRAAPINSPAEQQGRTIAGGRTAREPRATHAVGLAMCPIPNLHSSLIEPQMEQSLDTRSPADSLAGKEGAR